MSVISPGALQIRVLRVPHNPLEPASVRWVGESKRDLAACIGAGLLACIAGPGWHCYLEEDAHLYHPINLRASRLMTALGWTRGRWIHGDVIFLSHQGEGPESSVTDYMLALARRTGLQYVEEIDLPPCPE
jgi:hypothetical protein